MIPTPPAKPLTWSDALLLGHGPMDETHREFVACLDGLRQAAPGDAVQRAAAMLDHLEDHFGQERRWMEDTAFPATQCHVDEHEAVLRSAREVLARQRDGASLDELRSFAAALEDWFPGHADYMDAALSHWMSKRAFGGSPVVLRRGVARAAGEAAAPPQSS